MAFFDDLGKKLTQAGQSAVQKTKEVADIAKLNSLIYDEEKRISNNYLEIGKLYVSLHADGHEADYDEMIAAIRESEAKIKECRHQITEIKGIVVCEKCGAEVPVHAAFCSTCGAPMPVKEPEEVVAQTPAEEVVEPAQTEEEPEVVESAQTVEEPEAPAED